uniref:Uncharacterized protein n=1 Tax=Anguilla anguilla TaxID=7936 RepID=A0A0E9PG90_ANGAN
MSSLARNTRHCGESVCTYVVRIFVRLCLPLRNTNRLNVLVSDRRKNSISLD